jgi:hypothetical protein
MDDVSQSASLLLADAHAAGGWHDAPVSLENWPMVKIQ